MTYETCVRSLRKSSKSCLVLHHSRHHHSHRHRSYRHRHQGSYERYGRPYRTNTPSQFGIVRTTHRKKTYLITLLGSALAASNGTSALGALTADVAALATSVTSLVVLGAFRTVTA
ncbi:hypothetical protein GGR55DRAFT_606884 [Xylaria sp. FL0064]|nr:hypothetical protein GGR55DRAFT_606884 [Xylaria sp. FL0064]